MDEQRTQQYLSLINQLLSCNQGDEPKILQDNQELLDQGLIEIMIAVAQQFEEEGRENEAQFLMSIAQQLAQALGLLDNATTESTNTSQDYLDFLVETLQKVSENPDPQVIYTFWAQNLDKLDDNLKQVLDSWAKNRLASAKAEEAEYIAGDIGNFSNLIRDFTLNNIGINQEIAITGYQIVLMAFTFEDFPQDWAMTQHSLANVYLDRIREEKADNLEKAINCCTEALKVYTFEAFPDKWASTQQNMGYAYLNRIRGERADNLEKAINCWTETLKVYTFEAFPVNWAMTQYNLGNAYLNRIRRKKADNLEQAIVAYTEALKVYTFEAFPIEWATAQHNLANAYRERIKGERVENLEKAVVACMEALKVYTVEAFRIEWASTQHNLANVYLDRIRGKKAENLEKAISANQQALKIYTFKDFPQDWANTQNNLATAYCERIRGDRAENLEKAITYYTEALKVYTFEAFPDKWAMTQNNLIAAYWNRIRGERAENLEKAIFACMEALKVYTFEDFPIEWATAQHNLANAYRERIKGERAENLEKAIVACMKALKVRSFEAFPDKWAKTQNNLASAYSERIRGDRADNLEKAIAYYTEAWKKVYTFEAFPDKWAKTQNNLASAYSERIRGDRADNLEKAISANQQALKVYTFKDFPQDWARTQHNLANAYCERIRGDRAENLEKAIAYYTEALKVRTFEAFPVDWAMTQNNLGNAYRDRIRGKKTDNLEQAIASYHNALKIDTKEDNPLNCLQTARSLANLHYREKQWQPATEAYHTAIQAVENARLEALNPQSRQEVLSKAIDVFHGIVQAYLNLNQPEKALEYIERSKGRNLVELMTQKELKPQGVSQETIDKLAQLKQQVVNEQIRLQHQSINQNLMRSNNLNPYVQDHSYLKEYQQELDIFITKNITPYNPTFNLTQKVKPIPFEDIKSLTDDSTCLLQWYITGENILAFIVSANETVKLWQSSEDDRKQLFETLDNYLELYYSETGKKEWINQLANLLQTFADTLHINEIISLIPETCERLIIIPHWFLHILPIHAFPIGNNCVLQDKYDIQYAPSCQLLQITKQRPLNQLTNLFAIQNPTKDSLFVDFGMETIRHFFKPNDYVLSGNKAIKNNLVQDYKLQPYKIVILAVLKGNSLLAMLLLWLMIFQKSEVLNRLKDSNCFHFFGHGKYNRQSPLESALILANHDSLTLREIFYLKLEKCRLVILSACETGIIDINSISDEYIGLPSGFIFAGSPNIISSLWVVNQVSTAFLMIELYENITQQSKQNNIDITIALKDAQNNLREMTNEGFKQRLNQYQSQLDTIKSKLSRVEQRKFQAALNYHQQKSYPFSHPSYWAAFVSIGR